MNTNTAEIRVTLDSKTSALLARPVNGSGGFQSLLRKLQSKTVFGVNNVGNVVYIDASLASRLMKIAKSGEPTGGYQRRLQPLIDQIVPLRKALYTRKRA